jgi:hypothetical protein
MFRSALPREERPHFRDRLARSYPFRSALPREERRSKVTIWRNDIKVSIRAPA